MTPSEITSLICAILSLGAAVLIGVWQIRQNSRVNKLALKQAEAEKARYDNALYSEATRFILKYSSPDYESQILLLPMCVMAYKYNSIYPYRREIYREFCILSEELQNLILERCKLSLKTGRCKEFFDSQVEFLKSVIKENYPGDRDIFYEGAKYLERALIHHGQSGIPEIKCAIDKEQQAAYDNYMWMGPKPSEMNYKDHITNLLAYEKTKKPISRLFVEPTSIGCPDSADEILISYLCCEVAKYVACYSWKDDNTALDIGLECDFSGTRTMEDLFLNALLYIYCYGGYEHERS